MLPGCLRMYVVAQRTVAMYDNNDVLAWDA